MGVVMLSLMEDALSDIWFLLCLVWWYLVEPEYGDSIWLKILVPSLKHTRCLYWGILPSSWDCFPSCHQFVRYASTLLHLGPILWVSLYGRVIFPLQRFVWLLDAQMDNRCYSFYLKFARQVPYLGISSSHWGELIEVVVHGRVDSIDYFMWEPSITLEHIPHFDEMDGFVPCICGSLFYKRDWCLHDQFFLL